MQLNARFRCPEFGLLAEPGKEQRDRLVTHLLHIFASVTNHERRRTTLLTGHVTAGDKGVQTLQPVNPAHANQLFQGAINLQRRPKAGVAKLIENHIGAHWVRLFFKHPHDKPLIVR